MRLILAFVLVGLVSFFFGLGSVGFIGPDESRYAQVARGMLERADWVTPHLRGEPWLDKPPLYYWAAAGSMSLLGETETAARLPAAMAAVTACIAIAFVGTRWFGFAAGLRSALVLASSLGMVLYGRAAIMDSLLTVALTIGLGAYALYVTVRPSRYLLITASVAIGAGVLTKGPIAVVLPLLIIVPFHLLDRLAPIRRKSWPFGTHAWSVQSEINGPLANPTERGIGRHGDSAPRAWIFQRFTTAGTIENVGSGLGRRSNGRPTVPTATHLTVAAASFLIVVIPWHAAILQKMGWEFVEVFFLQHNVDRFLTTVHRHPGPIYYYLPVLAVALFPWSAFVPAAIARAMRGLEARRSFLFLWIASPVVFFSLSGSKLPGYLLPVLPPFALLIGLLWAPPDKNGREEATGWLNRSLAFHVALCIVLAVAALRAFTGPEMATGSRWLAVSLVGLGAGAYVVGRRRPGAAFGSLTASSVSLTLLVVLYLAPMLEPHQSLKTLATRGLSELKPGERVICYKAFYPRAHFYTRDRLGEIWTLEEFRIRAAEWGRIIALTEPHHYREIDEDASLDTRVIARSGKRLLVEARPTSAAGR